MCAISYCTKRPNFKLESEPKQLLGSFPLAFAVYALLAGSKFSSLTILVDAGVVLQVPEVVDVLPGRRDDPLAAVLEEVVQE
jgi:hypothetical protein